MNSLDAILVGKVKKCFISSWIRINVQLLPIPVGPKIIECLKELWLTKRILKISEVQNVGKKVTILVSVLVYPPSLLWVVS